MKFPGIVFVLLFPLVLSAHHSVTAPFTDEEIQIEGVVTEFRFVNPHVNIFLNVTDENGTETRWMATSGAPDTLRRTGWSADSIQAGQHLRLTGLKGRQGRPMLLVDRELWNSGGIIELDPEDGSVLRALSGDSDRVDDGPSFSRTSLRSTLNDTWPNLAGYWSKLPSVRASNASPGRNSPPLNDRGQRIQDGFDAISDPSYTECAALGLVRQASTVKPLHITQFMDRVVFDYEEGGAQRVIYLDVQTSAPNGDKTALGRATARYEEDTLIIESDQILGNLTGAFGNEISDEHTVMETYRRVEDDNGSGLEMVMVVTDPLYLTAPWEVRWTRYYSTEYDFTEVDCRLPMSSN